MIIERDDIEGELVTFGIPWRGKVVGGTFQPPGSNPTPPAVTFSGPHIPSASGTLMTSPLPEADLPTTTLDAEKGYQWKRDFVANRGLYGLPINQWMMMDDYGRVHVMAPDVSYDPWAEQYTVTIRRLEPAGLVFWGESVTVIDVSSQSFNRALHSHRPIWIEVVPAPNGRKAALHLFNGEDLGRLIPGYSGDGEAWCIEILETTLTGNPEHGETPSTLSASIAVVHAYADVRGPAWNDTETVVDQPTYYNLQFYEERIFRAFYDQAGARHRVNFRHHYEMTSDGVSTTGHDGNIVVTYTGTLYIDGVQKSQYIVTSTRYDDGGLAWPSDPGAGETTWNRDGQITNEAVYYNNQNVIGKWGWPRDYDGRVFGLVDAMTAPTVNCVGKYTDSASDTGNADQYAAWDWYNGQIASEPTDTVAFI